MEQKAHYVGKTPLVEEGEHECKALIEENLRRENNGELKACVFQDIDNNQWNIRVGLEFISVRFCPFCGKKVSN